MTSSFLAIGESDGTIKFAAAEGTWLYCTDITDNAEYNDEETSMAIDEEKDPGF